MKTQVLAIDLIQVLGSVQPRETLSEDAIADYAEQYTNDGTAMPALRVFHDGERYILSRGFHRHTAAVRAKRDELQCEIVSGDERAAILDAMQDNAAHGVRRTPADKRKAVSRLLDDPEWGKLTQAKVAELANVSLGLVKLMVGERKPKTTSGGRDGQTTIPSERSTGADGKEYPKTKPGVKGGIEGFQRAENIEKLDTSLRKAVTANAVKVTDDQLDTLVKAAPSKQEQVRCFVLKDGLSTEAAMVKAGLLRGKDGRTDSGGTDAKESSPRPPRSGTDKAGVSDRGKCPNCAGSKWTEDEDGVYCSKCRHPHGEPAGDVDKDRISIQRSKTIKTAEALMRAFDDLNLLVPKPGDHARAVDNKDSLCKQLLKLAKGWK